MRLCESRGLPRFSPCCYGPHCLRVWLRAELGTGVEPHDLKVGVRTGLGIEPLDEVIPSRLVVGHVRMCLVGAVLWVVAWPLFVVVVQRRERVRVQSDGKRG